MTEIIPFEFDSTPVRVVEIDGDPWFVLADLAAVLEIQSVPRLASRLDDDMRQTHTIPDRMGRDQQMTVVSEPGMYDVIVRSDSPNAKPFRRWITTEVLPMIRKTGSYSAPLQLTDEEIVHRALQITSEKVRELEARNAELEPKAEAFDGFLGTKGDYSLNEGAKLLARNGVKGIGQNRLRDVLLRWGWLYRGRKNRLRAKQAQIDLGRMNERTSYYYDDETGERKTGQNQAVITAKGLFVIMEKLSKETGFIVIEGEAS